MNYKRIHTYKYASLKGFSVLLCNQSVKYSQFAHKGKPRQMAYFVKFCNNFIMNFDEKRDKIILYERTKYFIRE